MLQCINPLHLRNPRAVKNGERHLFTSPVTGVKYTDKYITVPCGKCYACQCNKRKHFYGRLIYERKNAVSCYFLTLTYNEENLPMDADSGLSVVNYRDVQAFLKRFRKNLCIPRKQRVRFYCVGEYGDVFNRPHYHIILFFNYFESRLKVIETARKSWNYGWIDVANKEVNERLINYVSTYVTKSVIDEASNGRPTCLRASKHLGVEAYKKLYKNYLHSSNHFYFHLPHGEKFTLPRCFADSVYGAENAKLHRRHLQYVRTLSGELTEHGMRRDNDSDEYAYILRYHTHTRLKREENERNVRRAERIAREKRKIKIEQKIRKLKISYAKNHQPWPSKPLGYSGT